ncbi:hypothetical protein A2954_02005 [Candidatus Roizmanbacteria bacterium RIFCSPLOWO2_01_FULL_37_12]|uniref:O-antigen ligase-related domain-containing protein n=1 Tax=Candidatus Roizmanbacteria bacterium RIFCSPLOWO2_01_FULL_37_12 TaxID=1802056 RepID=A0A1F7IFH2_9BACT|nr:MAG: hypothetical protein A2954_02005 [Candidatus Roizmanbacteria bacterium RIFCSPLOWO2_01_FULL_37_12]
MKKQKQKKKQRKNNQAYSSAEKLGKGDEARLEVSNLKLDEKRTYFQTLLPNLLLNPLTVNKLLLFLFLLLLPTQYGKHFFFDFSYLSGIRVDYLAPTIYLTDLLAAVILIFNLKSVIKFFLNKKIVILLSLLLFNVLISQNIFISVYRYIKILELLGIVAVFRNKGLSLKYLLSGLLIGGVFELFLSMVQYINKHSLQGIFYFFGERILNLSLPGIAKASLNGIEILRPYGTFSHPNSLAGFYLLIYFLVLTYKKFSDSIAKNSLLFVCGLLIFISFSKIAITTFLLLNFIYLWKSPLKKTCVFCFFSRIFILGVVALVFLQATTDQFTLQKRIYLMQNALSIINQHLFFGVGMGNYLINQQQFPQRFADFLNQPVHNLYLLLISEVGITIFAAVFFLFFAEFNKTLKKFPYVFGVILLTGLFDHYWLTLQQNFLLIAVILGAL